jgi:hypothetical protein
MFALLMWEFYLLIFIKEQCHSTDSWQARPGDGPLVMPVTPIQKGFTDTWLHNPLWLPGRWLHSPPSISCSSPRPVSDLHAAFPFTKRRTLRTEILVFDPWCPSQAFTEHTHLFLSMLDWSQTSPQIPKSMDAQSPSIKWHSHLHINYAHPPLL